MASLQSATAATAPWSAREKTFGLTAGAVVLALLMVWETTRPTLPVAYELAAGARVVWRARLPMMGAAAIAMIALYMFLHVTLERRVAVYAVAILATTPTWFANARLASSALLPLAGSALVLAGAGLAAFAPAQRMRLAGGALALVATAGAVTIAPERGLLVIVVVPFAGVLLARALSARSWRASWPLFVLAAALALAWLTRRDLLLGITAGAHAATYEAPVSALAYGLVPWTPFVPFAIAQRPRSGAALAVVVTAVLGIVVHALLATRSAEAPFVAVAAIAAALAVLVRSLEDARRPAVSMVATIAVIGFLVAHDVAIAPERALVPFGAGAASSAATGAALAIRSSTWLAVVLAAIALLVPRAWLPAGRGLAIVIAGTLAGLVLRLHAYPGILERLAPGAAFEAWAKRHGPNEPLGSLGLDVRALTAIPAASLAPQSSGAASGAWLAGATDARRFLALDPKELASVNAAYRAARGSNVPLLVGDPGAPLLAVSALRDGERSQSMLDRVLLDDAPANIHALSATLGDRLDVLGWQITDDDGAVLAAIPHRSRHAHLRLFFRVKDDIEPALAGHCTFVHLESSPSRFSAEHRELAYPITLWRRREVIADDYDLQLPARFREGTYRLYVGVGVLPCDDDRRLHVTSGPSDGHDRVLAGALEVR